MDSSGNNRYMLLFMDDDVATIAAPKPSNTDAGKNKNENARQSISKNEKENKKNILINNSNAKIRNTKTGSKENAVQINKNDLKQSRTKNFRMNSANNVNSNPPEYGNELPERQMKERENKTRARASEKFGKREFDRQSGSDKTGIKSIDKRDGAGAHNWGSAKQDIEELKGNSSAPMTDKEDSANELTGDTNNLEEDELKQMTLDEWKALKNQRAKPSYNLRKAGEGVDNSEWKKMTVLSKKKAAENEEEFEYDPSMYPQRVGRLQRIVDIQFNFNDERKYGIRKGPRVSVRGGNRSEATAASGFEKKPSYKFADKQRSGPKPLKVDDEIQFPTLS